MATCGNQKCSKEAKYTIHADLGGQLFTGLGGDLRDWEEVDVCSRHLPKIVDAYEGFHVTVAECSE